MLIAGRTIQGLGAGGVFVLVNVVSDLVPLQQRAKYLGLVRVAGAIGFPLGPIVGGSIAAANWRWCFYHGYESTRWCKEPMVPNRVFLTRTSAAGFFMAFDGALLIYWVIWFLPIYFQGILGAYPLTSGVYQLPFNLLVPSGIIAGDVMAKTGKYKPQHFVGFGLVSIGMGLFTLPNKDSPKVAWAWFQIIAAFRLGVIMTAVLPSIQAALLEEDVARITAVYTFLRSFGGIWSVTIPSVIFNSQIDHFQFKISSEEVRQQLSDGKAYGFASMGQVQSLPDGVRDEVLEVYTDALKTVWRIGLAFSLAGFLAVFAVKQYDISRENATKFGLKENKKDSSVADEEATNQA
ncbi:major facilitator superfamily domain-containing protein [Xylaria palmicola]|nr:major facilitator superfamily domain-containing protein [Xylaria palmicola]